MSKLKKIVEGDALHQADDDHPDRKDLTDKEATQVAKEIYDKFKKDPKIPDKNPDAMAQATIDALNKIK